MKVCGVRALTADDFVCKQDLLDKCQACMKIIRVAKDEQAEKANEYATILLEELDLEKTREEFKKMAAARRKERKRNKKLQKMFEKRKQQETDIVEEDADEQKNDEEDADDGDQPSTSKDKKEAKGRDALSTLHYIDLTARILISCVFFCSRDQT